MKNKALTYILLLVVGLIWYQVFHRVTDNLFAEDSLPSDPNSTMMANFSMERDTFVMLAEYRDPFVEDKKPSISLDESGPPRPPVQAPPRVAKLKTQWPPITYFGQVRRTGSKDPLAILKVDGLQLMLRRGEEIFGDIVLKEIWRDSVLVLYKKEKHTFYRN